MHHEPRHQDQEAPRAAIAVAELPPPTLLERLSWLPAVLLVVWVVACLLWGGASMRAFGATSIDVTGVVDKEVHLTLACPAATLAIGTLVPGDPAKETPTDCVATYGSTNSSAGADLQVSDAGGPGNAMRCVSASCGAQQFADYEDTTGTANFPAGASRFGMRLASVGPLSTATWNVNGSAIGSPGSWYDVQDTPDSACTTSSIGDGTCGFRWGAAASAVEQPGTYAADVQFDVLAR